MGILITLAEKSKQSVEFIAFTSNCNASLPFEARLTIRIDPVRYSIDATTTLC